MKPFSLQAPEEVAKEYGGNKQKIMAAAQTGVVDPTAAVLAGMFIDRMRSAAQAEQSNPPTIAQQVMAPPQGPPPGGPGGPPPGGPPPGGPGGPPPGMGPPPGGPGGPPPGMEGPPIGGPPAGGLGATPEAQGMPPPGGPPPEGPPPGMADGGAVENVDRALNYLSSDQPTGGLDSLPVSDSMFEADYAGGGIVAFASGAAVPGGTSPTPNYRDLARQLLPSVIQVETGGRGRPGPMTKYGQAQGIAQMLPSTARQMAQKRGVAYDEGLLTGNTPEAVQYQKDLAEEYLVEGLEKNKGDLDGAAAYYHGGPNSKLHGPKTRDYVSKVRRARGGQGATGEEDYQPYEEVDTTTHEGRRRSLEDIRGSQMEFIKSLPRERRDKLMAQLDAEADPALRKKERSSDLWARLAEFGANLASTPGPLLAAAGEAAKEPLKGVREDSAARKKGARDDLKTQAELEGMDRAEGIAAAESAGKIYGVDVEADQQTRALKSKESQAALDRANDLAKIRLQNEGQLAGIRAQVAGELDKLKATNSAKDMDIPGIIYTNTLNALMQRKKDGLLVGPRGRPITDDEVRYLASQESEKAKHPKGAETGDSTLNPLGGGGGAGGGGYGKNIGAPPATAGAPSGAVHLGSI